MRALLLALGLLAPGAFAAVDFARDIAPVLEEKCFLCHGPDVKKPKAGLRLDNRRDLLAFRGDGPLLTPGQPEHSRLHALVSLPHGHEDLMPPEGRKEPLEAAQVERIRQWIVEGANFGTWERTVPAEAAGAPDDTAIPTDPHEATRAVEAGLEAGRQRAGVQGTGPIPDETFLRRVYLDIAGRIPTLEEANAFLDAKDPGKRAGLIDQLLASEAHVSRMYLFWADIFRIREGRWGQVAIRAFEEWLKSALRANRPWDAVIRDILLATGNALQNPAVGFWYRDYEMPLDNLAYTTQTLLGTQMDCAVCHNHPFDRWSQYEFFELAAFLNEPVYRGYLPGWVTREHLFAGMPRYRQKPVEVDGRTVVRWLEETAAPAPAEVRRVEERNRLLEERLRTQSLRELGETLANGYVRGHFSGYVQDWGRRRVELETERRASGAYPSQYEGDLAYASARLVEGFNTVLDFHLHREGRERARLPDNYQYDDAKPNDWVAPSVPFGTAPARRPGQPIHAVLAEWMTAPENPRFTRVLANRMFRHVYGIGLYAEHDNIRDDSRSSHPELSRLLEGLLRRNGHDLRAFLRVLYNTPTYQSAAMQPASREQALAQAPRWPWTFAGTVVSRLPAEALWDSLVTLSLPAPDERRRYYRYRDTERWRDLTQLAPEALLARGREVVREEYELRRLEAIDPDAVRPTHVEPVLHPSAAYRGWSEELARASELPQPVPAGHPLRLFGASDREMIENSHRSTNVPQALALLNHLVDRHVLASSNPRRGFPGSPVARILESPAAPGVKIRDLYRAILARDPTAEERQIVGDTPGPADLQDLAWALVNGEEFRIRY